MSDIQGNQQPDDLPISRIDERVNAVIRSRNENRRYWIIGISTVIVLALGVFGPPVLRNYVDGIVAPVIAESVDSAVAESVGSAVAKAEDAIRFDIEVMDLNFRMLNLDRSEGFTPEEAESITTDIQSLVSSHLELKFE